MAGTQSDLAVRPQPSELTKSNFVGWTKQCRTRQVLPKYEEFSQEAKTEGTNLSEVMRAKGFTNQRSFDLECEQFSLWCNPKDLAELGSGIVLYFYFLRFLAFVLLMLVVFSLPAMVTYGREDSLEGWWWHDWKSGGWRTARNTNGLTDTEVRNENTCSCLGSNKGFQIDDTRNDPVGFQIDDIRNASYGTYCAVWDLAWCQSDASSSAPEEVGKWCCATWCFASLGCEVTSVLGTAYHAGLVRSSVSCLQDPGFVASACADYNDTSFQEAGSQVVPSQLTWKLWLTPGNMGPERCTSRGILVLYFVLVVLISVVTMVWYQHQVITDRWVDVKTTVPSDFAVQVKGLPVEVTDEDEIAEFFKEHAVKDMDTEVVQVIIAWDPKEFRDSKNDLQKLRKEARALESGGGSLRCCRRSSDDGKKEAEELRKKEIMSEIHQKKEALYSKDRGDLKSCGKAIVVFRTKESLEKCLDRWNGWRAWLQRAGVCSCCGDLPLFKDQLKLLQVSQAANPGEINWMDFGVKISWHQCVRYNCVMVALVLTSFFVTWAMNLLQEKSLRDKSARDSSEGQSLDSSEAYEAYKFQAMSLLPAVVISIVNSGLTFAAYGISVLEKHDTLPDQYFSQTFKTTYARIINTAGVTLWVNATPKEWYQRGGLVDDVLYMLIIDAVLGRILNLIDYAYIFSFWHRCTLSEKKCKELNNIIRDCHGKPKTPETEEELEMAKEEVDQLKLSFQPMELDTASRYAQALTTFLVCLWYAPVLPLLPLCGVIGLILQYILDKWLVLRWCQRPKPANGSQAKWSLSMVHLAGPLGLSIGFFVFLTPSWREPRQVVSMFMLCMVVSLANLIIPLRFWTALCCINCWFECIFGSETQTEDLHNDYYQAQHLWQKEMMYHKDHFLYKDLPKEINPTILSPETKTKRTPEDIKALLIDNGRMKKAVQRLTFFHKGRDSRVATDQTSTEPSPTVVGQVSRSVSVHSASASSKRPSAYWPASPANPGQPNAATE